MKADPVFSVQISRVKRLILRRRLGHCFTTGFSFALIFNTVALGVQELGIFPWQGYAVYAWLVLFGFALAVLLMYRTRRDLTHHLIALDGRLDLKDRLSTAYEYDRPGRQSLFADLLIRDAGTLLAQIKEHHLFPPRFRPAHVLIPVFTGLMMTLLLVDFFPGPFLGDADRARLHKIGTKMDRLSREAAKEDREGVEDPGKDLYSRMEEIAEEIKNPSKTGEKELRLLWELKKEAEKERLDLARKIENELGLGDASEMPMLAPLTHENILSGELDGIRNKLKDLFGGEVPLTLARDISDLGRDLRLEKFLGEAMDEIAKLFKKGADSYRKEDYLLAFDREATEGTDPSKPSAGSVSGSLLAGKEARRGIGPGSGESGEGPADSEGEDAFAAGRGRSSGAKRPPSPLKGSQGPAFREEGTSGPGDRYRVEVRSLPAIGKAGLDKEEILRSYGQEIEEVLRKEEIPLRYREYVRNYFLSIGLRKEEDDRGNAR